MISQENSGLENKSTVQQKRFISILLISATILVVNLRTNSVQVNSSVPDYVGWEGECAEPFIPKTFSSTPLWGQLLNSYYM